MTLKTKLSLDTQAEFTWNFDKEFLLRVVNPDNSDAYFVWSSPEYGGNNTIYPFLGNPLNFTRKGVRGREKGIYTIGRYCGNQVKFINC